MYYIRPKDKIEKYIEAQAKRFEKNCKCEFSFGVKSRYYFINGKSLRISDHIGNCSDAHISIIIPSFKTGDNYLIHAHQTGLVSMVSYEMAKELVRSFFYLATFMNEVVTTRSDVHEDKEEKKMVDNILEELKELKKYKEKCERKSKLILGLPLDYFTEGQLKQIQMIIHNVKEKHKLK